MLLVPQPVAYLSSRAFKVPWRAGRRGTTCWKGGLGWPVDCGVRLVGVPVLLLVLQCTTCYFAPNDRQDAPPLHCRNNRCLGRRADLQRLQARCRVCAHGPRVVELLRDWSFFGADRDSVTAQQKTASVQSFISKRDDRLCDREGVGRMQTVTHGDCTARRISAGEMRPSTPR